MGGQQQPLAIPGVQQQATQQRAFTQVQAGLDDAADTGQLRRGADLDLLGGPQRCRRDSAATHPARPGKAQAQGIVLGHQRLQGTLQQQRVEAFARLQQYRLVPVLANRDRALERAGSASGPPHRHRTLCPINPRRNPGHLGQSADGLLFEHILGGQQHPSLTGTSHQLQGHD